VPVDGSGPHQRVRQEKAEGAGRAGAIICKLIDEEYTRRPFYGSRKMVVYLKGAGHHVNRKRVQRLMRQMGLASMAPGPNTSKAHP
jgi:putative transposase